MAWMKNNSKHEHCPIGMDERTIANNRQKDSSHCCLSQASIHDHKNKESLATPSWQIILEVKDKCD